jgi:uncharacterized damage-inducible protein DinB
MLLITRPAPTEYAPYYGRYIDLVPGDDLIRALREGGEATRRLVEPVPESRGDYRYAPGKWSLKEVLAHVADGERVFAYRALRFARRDETPLPGFDQDRWIADGEFDARSLPSLLEELRTVRAATLALFESFDEAAWDRSGTANDVRMSVRSLGFVIAGHEIHHQNVLRERYQG